MIRRRDDEGELRTEVWPGLGEEIHTESCPHRLVECGGCELIMAQYEV